MLAVVKKPRSKKPKLEIKGDIPKWMLIRLKKEYGKELAIAEQDDFEYVNIFETDWYREIEKKTTPGDSLKIYRDNFGFSQAELGKKLGNIPRQNISAMENGKRGISKNMAKKLSKIFNVPVDRFI